MSNDPVSHWTRQIAVLRAQAAKRGRAAPGEITDGALEICDALLRDLAGAHLECDRVRAEIRIANAAWEALFDVMPAACLLTDGAGSILNANRAAGVLLNLNAKRLKDRELVVFSEDRMGFEVLLRGLASHGGDEVPATLTFRPRERKPAAFDVVVRPLNGRPGLWLWFLTPATKMEAASLPNSSPGKVLSAAS